MRGRLIVFEGLDRSGKSTQARRLAGQLEGSLLMSFPNRTTKIASMIDAYLKSSINLDDSSVHLLFAANRWECRNLILEAVEQGRDVVLDRYSYSGVAYSAAKGLDLAWCKSPEQGLPKPDVVFFLRCSAEDAKLRAEYGGERYENIGFQLKVAEKYEEVMRSVFNFVEIDALKGVEEISCLVLETVRKIDNSLPLGVLW